MTPTDKKQPYPASAENKFAGKPSSKPSYDELVQALKPFSDFLDGIDGFRGQPQHGEFYVKNFIKDGEEQQRRLLVDDFREARRLLSRLESSS